MIPQQIWKYLWDISGVAWFWPFTLQASQIYFSFASDGGTDWRQYWSKVNQTIVQYLRKIIVWHENWYYCQRPRPQMRKSMSLADEDSLDAADTRVGALRQTNHSIDTSQVHNSKASKDLSPTNLRTGSLRQKKSSVSSFRSSLDSSSKVPSESDQAERRKKFSLCTGSSYDSQLSLQLQGQNRQRKLSLVSLPASNQSSSLSSPKVWHSFTIINSALSLYRVCNLWFIGGSRFGARATINRSKTVQWEVGILL